MNHDYWADTDEGHATVIGLTSRLEKYNGHLRVKKKEGAVVIVYSYGNMIVRGRSPEGLAYIFTLSPKGFSRSVVQRNYEALENIAKEVGIKLTEVRE
jgi:hypothetical protein